MGGENSCDLFDNTYGVLFLGTPFRGTHAWFYRDAPELARQRNGTNVNERILRMLDPNEEELNSLREDFLSKAEHHQNLELACFWETEPSNVARLIDRSLPDQTVRPF